MNSKHIKSFLIGFLVFLSGAIISANLGEFFDGDSVENARSYIITFSVLFLASVVAVSTFLILEEMRKNK
ncbi:hypothetical protein BJV85_000208 [Clostridium acetobutylicum]|uniref:hypothetical protein n=1 Tax=Clostridium TaxID=1485 RepID=UPI000200C413|nr:MULTISPECIES: hypothetical protein [Clostridium]ADZ22735.1 permease [Clostridium acetobutylicum EA 2018]AEI32991.1 permease [Clostridium acetobutylicum DSM 1731]KHD35439.1 permease [Clostridium acetobutylicum]MBC2393963.1 permease [Clostridium acetobutylicum]MBC2585508.1 permease [Clostridium acetobutylicum]